MGSYHLHDIIQQFLSNSSGHSFKKGTHEAFTLKRRISWVYDIVLVDALYHLITLQPDLNKLRVAFDMGKDLTYYQINSIYENLGTIRAIGLPAHHALTCCDTNYQFFGKGKKSTWDAWKCFAGVSEAFDDVAQHPFVPLKIGSPTFKILERCICTLYDKTTILESVNELRRDIFAP